MSLIAVVVFLLVVGVILALVPMEPTIRSVVVALAVILVLLWALSYFGVLPAHWRFHG